MNFFEQLFQNQVFMVAFWSWLIAQVLKVFTTLWINKELNFNRLMESGGMPSSHTSFVIGLSTAVGLVEGWASTSYAISLVFGLIVMYDASGVRRSVGKQAKLLNTIMHDILEHHHITDTHLKELVGHTPFEVFAGAILGVLVANIML